MQILILCLLFPIFSVVASEGTSSYCAPSFPSRESYFEHYLPQMKRACDPAQPVANCAGTSPEALTENEYYVRLMNYIVPHTYYCNNQPGASCNPAWPVLADTMLSKERLDNIRRLLLLAKQRNLPGSYLEAGVWRGGASIFARIVMDNLGLTDRHSYVCDSFQGLPAPRSHLSAGEEHYQGIPYLSVPLDQVKHHFNMYCKLDDSRVHFHKGFFVDSMPIVRKKLQEANRTLAVLRLDGDMYESTIDLLYNLYDLVDVGGFIIVDDWGWNKNDWKAKDAVLDFRAVHGIEDDEHAMFDIDGEGAYFRKAREITLKRELYPKNVRPASTPNSNHYRAKWEHILLHQPSHLGQTRHLTANDFFQHSQKIKKPVDMCQPAFPTRGKFMTHYMDQMKTACKYALNCQPSTPELILE